MDKGIREKNKYWQAVRGICILSVILIHCRYDTRGGGYYIVFRNLINFPVAVFFFISGFFVKIEKAHTKQWLLKRLKKLILPYLFWSLIYFAVGIINTGTNKIEYYLSALILGKAAAPFYYIIVLVLYTVITPLLTKALNSKLLSAVILLLTPTLQMLGYILLAFNMDIWNALRYTPIWIAFYYGGMMIKKYRPTIHKRRHEFLVMGTAVLIEIVESCLMLNTRFSAGAFGQYRVSGFIYATCVILCILMHETDCHVSDFAARLGDDSFAIFFIHYIFIIVLEHLIPGYVPLPIVHIVELVICVFGSELIIRMIRIMLKDKSSCLGC